MAYSVKPTTLQALEVNINRAVNEIRLLLLSLINFEGFGENLCSRGAN